MQSWHKGVITIGPRSDRVQLRVVSKEFLREPNKPYSTADETTEGEKGSSSGEEEMQKQFTLDRGKYARFLHNGYKMKVDDSGETILGSNNRANVAKNAGMGEYEVHYSSENDSDRDICDWLTSSESCIADCFCVDLTEEEEVEENGNEYEVKITQLQHQLEEQRLFHDQIIRELLEKLAFAQSEKDKSQLDVKHSRELISAMNSYHTEEIILLEQALVEKDMIIANRQAKIEASKGYIKALRIELQGRRKQEIGKGIVKSLRKNPRRRCERVQNRGLISVGSKVSQSGPRDDASKKQHDKPQNDEGIIDQCKVREFVREINARAYEEGSKSCQGRDAFNNPQGHVPLCKEVFLNTFMV